MSCAPIDIFKLAERLANEENHNEAQSRSAISRGYYAALLTVEQTFEKPKNHVRRDGESSHADIIGRALVYGKGLNPGRGSAAKIAKAMQGLRVLRNDADYYLNDTLDRQKAIDVIKRVKDVLEKCEEVIRKRSEACTPTEVS